ncbi:MAG: hypothetical protein LBQ14_09545 [Treponema sp.]|nr:hypothetical protein [Treponema sp.]
MTQIKTITVFPLFALIVLAASCSLMREEPAEAGLGVLRLTIAGTAGEGRTLVPLTDGISYDIRFTSGEKDLAKTMTAGSGNFLLEAGEWNIEVTAKKGTEALARGSSPVTVNAGESGSTVTVTLSPLTGESAAQGSLQWDVTYPEGVTAASLYISKADGTLVTGYNPFDIATVHLEGRKYGGTAALEPGTYLLRVRLTNGDTGMSAGNAEVFHIYPGQATSASYAFLPGEFSNTSDIGGNVPITHSIAVDITAVSISLYGDAGAATLLATENLTPPQAGNPWAYSSAVPDSYSTVYAAAKITANGKELSTPAQAVTVAASGADLTPVTVYGIGVEKTGTGTVTVNGEETASTAALAGETITLAATPGTDRLLGSLTVDGADYTVPFAITKDIAISAVFKFPITGIVIQRNGTTVSAPIDTGVDGTITLTAVLVPAGVPGTVTWESDDISIATVNPAAGAATTVTGIDEGEAVITVSAVNPDTQMPVIASVTVNVGGAADPNLIWEWSYAVNGGPSGTFASSSSATLTGTGIYTQVPIRIVGSNSVITDVPTSQGIQIDASGASGTTGILAVGTSSNTASTAASCPDGVFDFRTGNTNGIKITIGCQILTDASGTRGLSVCLNNSTATATNTPLRNSGNEARVIYFATPAAGGTLNSPTTNGVWDGANLISRVFIPDDFNQTYITTLEKAFLGICALGASGSNTGAKVLITSIRIEYVPAE